MKQLIENIYNFSLEDLMDDRFGRYSKSIIQDRALPDARDGLKPVQRRIIYGMNRDGNTYNKAFRKSAKTVGNVMGNYHPHGDSSIYDAMVRMSQWWKQNCSLIEIQGNNGSMDGDSAAAMRYTEARMSKIAGELVKDIKMNTVDMTLTFDDTDWEPTVLPCRFPNLLVNGSNGISAGYATNIPPHNLGEIIDATIKRIDSPNCRLDTITDIVKGPDFPTGGIVEGKDGIIEAFTTGRGRVIVKAKYHMEEEKKKPRIVIDEIPFDTNKSNTIRKIDDIRIDKKIDGILEVRDESDSEVRIAIDLKSEANVDLILAYLYKNTDLQISFNYNMVAIVNNRPMTLGIIPLLDAYITHHKEVVIRRTEYMLADSKARMHIVEGLIKALSILDEVIKLIRSSKNKSDAKINLVKEYGFTELQAEAIVVLQLYKLTNTDVTELEDEHSKLKIIIRGLEAILSDEDKLKSVIKDELRAVKKEYATERKSIIKDEITELKIEVSEMIVKEDVIVVLTKDGYVKRVSKRSYQARTQDCEVKAGDYVTAYYEMNTSDTVLLFTNLGNYLYVPVHELPDLKWKDMGKHISNIIKIKEEERIIGSVAVYDFNKDIYITSFTKLGMVKRSKLSDYQVTRYTKPMMSMKLKANDAMISISASNAPEVFITTKRGYGLWYGTDEIPVSGVKASGVKAISLKSDEVVGAHIFSKNSEYLVVITEKQTMKRVKLTEFDKTTRARKGVQIVRDVKTNPYYILYTEIPFGKVEFVGIEEETEVEFKLSDISIMDRYSTGSSINYNLTSVAIKPEVLTENDLKEENVEPIEKNEVSLKEIDEKILTIDDFLEEFESN